MYVYTEYTLSMYYANLFIQSLTFMNSYLMPIENKFLESK